MRVRILYTFAQYWSTGWMIRGEKQVIECSLRDGQPGYIVCASLTPGGLESLALQRDAGLLVSYRVQEGQ